MKLSEKCDNWSMNYEGPDVEINETIQTQVLAMMHLVGDTISLLPELENEEVQVSVMTAFSLIVDEMRLRMEAKLEEILAIKALIAPLEGDLSEEALFGKSIKNALISMYISKDDQGRLATLIEMFGGVQGDDNIIQSLFGLSDTLEEDKDPDFEEQEDDDGF